MTNTYTIKAWGSRRVWAETEVEANTPKAALAMARDELRRDPGQECDWEALWDEFIVEDQHGAEVLDEMEPIAELRQAAHELFSALQWLLDDMTDAGEDRNPETGGEYDSVSYARAIIASVRR
jgi:hypothetical protein